MKISAANLHHILKQSAPIEQAYKGPHRLKNLHVGEVSLVTEPAILSDAESQAGTGWYVVKSATGGAPVPEKILRMFQLREGEELFAARERLANACRIKMVTELQNQEMFWMDPLMVYTDHVVMGYWWYLSLEDIRTEKPLYYACYFTQDEVGEFTISRVVPLKVTIGEEPAASEEGVEKLATPPQEGGEPSADEVDDVDDTNVERAAYEGIDFTPPERVQSQFSKGVELYEAGKGGDGLQAATVRWARRLAAGEAVSPAKARKAVAWFARHETDKKDGWDKAGEETPGYVAWLLWGGDAGRTWFTSLTEKMDAADAKVEKNLETETAPTSTGVVDSEVAVEPSVEAPAEASVEVVEQSAPAVESEVTPEKDSAPVVVELEPGILVPEAAHLSVIKTLIAGGCPFSVTISPDGAVQVVTETQKSAEPTSTPAQAPEEEALRSENEKLQQEVRKLKAQPVADIPPAMSPAPEAIRRSEASSHDRLLDAARRQTRRE